MAAAVELAPEGATGGAGLIAYGLGFVFLALAVAWNYTIGAGLRSIAAEIAGVRLPRVVGGGRVFGVVADTFYRVDRDVHGALVAVANANLHAGRWLFNETARAWEWTIHSLAHLAVATDRAIEHFDKVVVPRWTRHALAHTGAFAVWLLHETERLERVQHDYTRRLLHRTSVTAHRTAIALPREVGHVRGRIGHVERDVAGLRTRLRGLEGKLAAGAFAALVVTALGRLGLRWLRCGNVNRVGRSVCGMNPALLESLLADALLVGGAISLVALAEEMQGVVGESAGLIQRFWRAA